MVKFPQGFLWGAATSAYQVEGDNIHSDWSPWEKEAGKILCAQACRHYEFYKQDFDLAKNLNHNAHRLSIEWGRIEPEEGKFSKEELQHYIDVILSLRARQIEPLVTLHHFTNPVWFTQTGGWADRRSTARFLRYCDTVVRFLAPHVRYWITINEPTIYLSHAYLFGMWPPQQKSLWKAKVVGDNLIRAHVGAYRLIHVIYKELKLAQPQVGFAQYTQAYVPCANNLKNRLAACLRDRWYNFGFLDTVARHRAMDFVGINYYTRQLVEVKKAGIKSLMMDVCTAGHHPVKKNSLGWDIYPEGLYQILLKTRKYSLPVFITENGISIADDNIRWDYIRAHLQQIHRALEEGVKVAGYLYWSLLDNFEWDKGFGPRFGLIDVDYGSFRRTIRVSAQKFSRVCQTGVLE